MKLTACYIDGFGKYANTRFDFADGLTPYVMANGEGKTTLAVFLRVMLYGMGTDKRGSFGVRSTYNPFSGAKYGGWLELEWQGKRYKIVREFHAASAAKDAYAVYNDRGAPCEDLGKVPGETVLGFTEEAFERTSYITWRQLNIDLDNGIGARLGGMSTGGETLPLSEALDSLEEYGKTYHSGRKKAGAYTGYIPEAEERIEDKGREIYRLESLQNTLVEQRAEWKACFAESERLGKEYESAQKAETVRARYESYRSLCTAAGEEQSKLEAIAAQYPQGFPTREETQALRESMDEIKSLHTRLQYRAFPKQKELAEKELQFAQNGIPTSEQLLQKDELIDKYNALTVEIAETQATAEQLPEQTIAPTQGKTSGARVLLWIAAAVLAAVGAILLPSQLPIGLGCIGLGLILAVLSFTVVKGKAQTAQASQMPQPAPVHTQSVALMQAASQLRTSLEDFFWRYGVRVSDFVAAMRILRADVQTLQSLRAESQSYEGETATLAAEEKMKTRAVESLLEKYALTYETWEEGYNASRRYAELAESVRAKQAQAESYKAKFGLTEEPKVVENAERLRFEHRQAEEKTRTAYERMRGMERELEELPKLRLEVEEERAKLAEYRERKLLIETAITTLKAADGVLKDRYLVPMQKSLMKYAKLMGMEWADSVSLGEELEIRFESSGQLRRAEHLSDGQRALATLCLRLAVIENVYEGELPFCILDDPFVHLDEKHLEEVKSGMNALSTHMQILYFTCHSSRSL